MGEPARKLEGDAGCIMAEPEAEAAVEKRGDWFDGAC